MKHLRRGLAILLGLLLANASCFPLLAEGAAPAELSATEAPSATPDADAPELECAPEAETNRAAEADAPFEEGEVSAAAPEAPDEGAGDEGELPGGADSNADDESNVPEGDPSVDPDGDGSKDSADDPELPPEEGDEADAPAIDYARSAAYSPDFARGYAELMGKCVAYAGPEPEAEAVCLLSNGTVYVLERRRGERADRLAAAFDCDGERVAWIDADWLRPLSPEEALAFAEARAAQEGARFLSGDATLPLDAPVCEPTSPEGPEETTPPPAMLVPCLEFVLGVGESCEIAAEFTDGEAHGITYATANSKVATVSAAGKVSAKHVGETSILLRSEFGHEVSVSVQVKKAPSKVSLSAPRKTLGVNEQLQLAATLPGGTASQLRFSTSDAAVATVSASGLVTTFAPGAVTFTVKTFNNKKASVKLTVKPAPEGVALDRAELSLGVGQIERLAATLSGGSAGAYSFSAAPEGVLRVDPATGEVEALAEGSAVVTVETYNHCAAACAVEVLPAPSEISFAESAMTIGRGERAEAPALTLGAPGERCAAGWNYKSSNAKIVTVSANGAIKGVRAGSANVTATTHNGKTASFKVTVKNAPGKVSLSAPRKTLGAGESVQLKATCPSGSASRAIAFSSSDPNVVAVDAAGLAVAVAPGTATVSVKTFNGKKASVKLTVKSAPEGVTLSAPERPLGVGESAKLAASLNEGSAGACRFGVDGQGVVEVNAETGALAAVGAGEAEVWVETYNGVHASRTVIVKPAPSCVTLASASAAIGVGEKLALPEVTLGAPGEDCAGSWSVKSSNAKIASVSADGVVKGVRAGKADIIVTAHNGATARLKVTVRKAPNKLTLTAPRKTLGVGESLRLSAAVPSGCASNSMTFASGNPEALAVDAEGNAIAIAPGSVTVTAKTYNNRKASVKLTVLAAPESASLPASLTLGAGESGSVAATLLPAGSGGSLTYSVDDPAVATVNASTGAIKAVSEGVTALRAETYNGLSAACELRVMAAPTGVSLPDGNFTLSVGDSRQLLPPLLAGEGEACGAFSYKSSSTRYVKVSASGLVKAVRAGSAKITVSTYNGKKASVTVTVKSAPKSISLAEAERTLFIGEEFAPEVKFANGVAGSYALESSDPAVAAIAGDGRSVRGVGGGEAVVTAVSFNGKRAQMRVRVPLLPERLWLEPAAPVLGVGDAAALTARMPDGQGARLSWENLDPEIASLEVSDNESASLRGLAEGVAHIRVRSANGLEAEVAVEVRRAPTALYLSPSRAERSLDEAQLQLRVSFGGAEEGGSVRFASSDEAVATVSPEGLVRFTGVGTARIDARTYNGHRASCALTVGERPGEMRFEREEYEVALGDRVRLGASFDVGCESYELRSSDETVVAAEGDEVRGLALGVAELTAVSRSGLRASCRVRVVPAPEGLELDARELELVIGLNSTARLSALPQGGAGSVRYVSDAPEIAAVDPATGEVTALRKGECTIRATTYNGHSAACAVRVRMLLEGVRVGIDPGHQAKGDMAKERNSPKGNKLKYRCADAGYGVAHVREHVINLQIGLKLRDALTKLGAEVYMTRETADVNISNRERALMMNDLGVDFVLRLHANAASASGANGLSIVRRKTCAYASSVVDGKALMQKEQALGSAIAKYFRQATGCNWRGLGASDEYTMNNWSKVPCLLVEVGFMTNPVEGKKIVDPAYQDLMVQGITNGICQYMGRELPTEW